MPLDRREPFEADKLGPAIAERFGRLDILVGNAGTLGTLSLLYLCMQALWRGAKH